VESGAARLSDRQNSSHRISLIVLDGQLACVGAFKAARPDYIGTISRKTDNVLEAENCVGESGYGLGL